jgi:transposase
MRGPPLRQIAWYLFNRDLDVSVVLPTKAKHYLRSLGNKSKNDKIDAARRTVRGLAQMGLDRIAEATESGFMATSLKRDLHPTDANAPASQRRTVSVCRN